MPQPIHFWGNMNPLLPKSQNIPRAIRLPQQCFRGALEQKRWNICLQHRRSEFPFFSHKTHWAVCEVAYLAKASIPQIKSRTWRIGRDPGESCLFQNAIMMSQAAEARKISGSPSTEGRRNTRLLRRKLAAETYRGRKGLYARRASIIPYRLIRALAPPWRSRNRTVDELYASL